ncbi:MAG: hydrogenase small subunit [Coriobacteriia bacterium]|nr:hydrogenase small subunit [Coriobacteriia bacterium]
MRNNTQSFDFELALDARGVSRRSFMKLCGAVAVAAGLGEAAAPRVAQALEESVIGAKTGSLYPVIWIEGASCTGCTESFAQVDTPDPATVVLEMLSLNYSETLSAAAGESMELAKEQTIHAGNYLLVYEGAILEGWGGQALRVADKPGTEHLIEAAESANAVVALGSCAVNGGWMGANPNSAGALGVQQFLEKNGIKTPVINIPGCPANPEWLVSVLVDVVMMGKMPELNGEGKPAGIFNQTIHDNCERRGHFENGEFVYEFGTKEEALGYCLYPLGCRGPQTNSNCGVTLWNHGRSWCVKSGAPCVGCCEAAPNDPGHNWVEVNTPFRSRHRDLRVAGITFQPEQPAYILTAVVAGALVIHGFGMKVSGRMDGGAPFEKVRRWDAKHPNKSIGDYGNIETAVAAQEALDESLKSKKGGNK